MTFYAASSTRKTTVTIDAGAVRSNACIEVHTDVPTSQVSQRFVSGSKNVVKFCEDGSTTDSLAAVSDRGSDAEDDQNTLIGYITGNQSYYDITVGSSGYDGTELTTAQNKVDTLETTDVQGFQVTSPRGCATFLKWDGTNTWSCAPL